MGQLLIALPPPLQASLLLESLAYSHLKRL